MNTNWFLAVLVEKDILDENVATELAQKLEITTYSHDFEDALNDIHKLMVDIEKK